MILDVHAELLSMSLQHTIAEEVETVRAGVLQRSLGLVDQKPEPGHDRARPRQSLGRVSAAEDDEVVGVVDQMRAKRRLAFLQTPKLEEAESAAVDQAVAERSGRGAGRRRAAA